MTSNTEQFSELAASYCESIENGLSGGPAAQAGVLAQQLASLYAQGCALAECWDDRFEELDVEEVSPEEYEEIRKAMAEVIDEYDYYWLVDPLALHRYAEPASRAGQLSDDLADLWRDLKIGLRTWERGSSADRSLAHWHWHFTFHSHWGEHVVDALKVLHRIAKK